MLLLHIAKYKIYEIGETVYFLKVQKILETHS